MRTSLLILALACGGCALPKLSQGYALKFGVAWQDNSGNELGAFVEESKAYKPVALPKGYQK